MLHIPMRVFNVFDWHCQKMARNVLLKVDPIYFIQNHHGIDFKERNKILVMYYIVIHMSTFPH